jgi:hypothetical protein
MDRNSNSIDLFKKEGILESNEKYETVYMTEEETTKFMEKYLKENPGSDFQIETRYLKPVEPVVLTQEIQVRWLVPDEPKYKEKKTRTKIQD